ncbi:MAG: DUF2079 domain-containing protein [Nitrospinota bacterium]|nr:DUF2079 domain-containing protein [Nitrospinota bacterium]
MTTETNQRIKHQPEMGAVAVLVLSFLYSGWFFHLSMTRHNALFSGLDFVHIDSACYSTAHGAFMWSNALMSGFFEHHVSPILFLISAFYLFSDSYWFILFFQAASAGLAAIPLYLFARGVLGGQAPALLLACAYLANGEMQQGVLYDYHMYSSFPLFAFSTLAALRAGRNTLAAISGGLLLATQEDAFITMAGVGLYLVVALKDIKRGAAIWGLSLAYAAVVFLVVYPTLGAPSPEAVDIGVYPAGVKKETGGFKYGGRYAWLGGGPSQIVSSFASAPGEMIDKLMATPERKHSWTRYCIQFLFLPLLSPLGLAMLFWPSMELFLSDYDMSYRLLGHYPMLLASTWFPAAILGIASLGRAASRLGAGAQYSRTLTSLAAAMLLGAQLFFGADYGALPLIGAAKPFATQQAQAHGQKGRAILEAIPPDASIAAHPGPLSHLNHRQEAYLFVGLDRFPFTKKKVDYVALDGNDPRGFANRKWQADDPRRMLLSRDYGLVAEDDHVYIFARGAAKEADYRFYMERFAAYSGKSLLYDPSSGSLSTPKIFLAAGEYTAIFQMTGPGRCDDPSWSYQVEVDGAPAGGAPLDCQGLASGKSALAQVPFSISGGKTAAVRLGLRGKGTIPSPTAVFKVDMSHDTFMANVK